MTLTVSPLTRHNRESQAVMALPVVEGTDRLCSLPEELLANICQFLPPKALSSLAQSCRLLNRIAISAGQSQLDASIQQFAQTLIQEPENELSGRHCAEEREILLRSPLYQEIQTAPGFTSLQKASSGLRDHFAFTLRGFPLKKDPALSVPPGFEHFFQIRDSLGIMTAPQATAEQMGMSYSELLQFGCTEPALKMACQPHCATFPEGETWIGSLFRKLVEQGELEKATQMIAEDIPALFWQYLRVINGDCFQNVGFFSGQQRRAIKIVTPSLMKQQNGLEAVMHLISNVLSPADREWAIQGFAGQLIGEGWFAAMDTLLQKDAFWDKLGGQPMKERIAEALAVARCKRDFWGMS